MKNPKQYDSLGTICVDCGSEDEDALRTDKNVTRCLNCWHAYEERNYKLKCVSKEDRKTRSPRTRRIKWN